MNGALLFGINVNQTLTTFETQHFTRCGATD
jgi:hypothetical protein